MSANVRAGSIEGDATSFITLGTQQLTVGSNNLSTEFRGVINDFSAGASLAKVGTGTLTLSNANIYSGGTTIAAGTIVAGHATVGTIDALGTGAVTLDGGALRTIVTGALPNDVVFTTGTASTLSAATGTTLTLGGALTIGNNATATFGSTTDTGTIVVNSSGVTVNSGTSLVVAGGVLQSTFQDNTALLAQLLFQPTTVTVNANAVIDFNDANTQFINNLNGAGTVKTGTAGNTNTLILLGDNGRTNVFSGAITGAHPVQINGGTMVFSGDNTYTGVTTICLCSTLQIGDGGASGAIASDINNGGTLLLNRSNTYTYGGVINDDGFDVGTVRQIGTGKTILTGTSTYTGNTFVDAGTLSVNGDIRTSNAVIVNSGGTLGGNGYVPSTQIRAGGTLAPGNSVGTLNIVGNLQFITGSSYAVEVSSLGADLTNVSGTATLGGARVTADVVAGSNVNKQYTILTATGGLIGRFNSSVTVSSSANFVASLSYDAGNNNVYLNLSLAFAQASPIGLNQNQQNVGNALTQYFNTNGGIPAVFGTLTAGGLTQTSGEPGASIPTAGFAAMNQFINAMMDNTGPGGGQPGVLGFAGDDASAYAPKQKLSRAQTDAYAAVTPRDRMPTPFATRWNVWATGYGGNSRISGDAATGSNATSTRIYGTAVGANYRLSPDTLLGFALGGAGSNFTVDNSLGGGRADVFQAGAYARHNMGAAYVAGALAYAWQDITTDRTVTVAGIDKLRAGLKANALAARLEGGWRTAALPVAMTPYAALQSTAFYLPSYGETAVSGSNQFALNYGSKTVTATRAELGAKFDRAMPVNDALLTLRARTAWAHDWNADRSALATFQSLPGAAFTVNGAQPSANAALLSAGADLAWGNGWTIAATFDGEFSRTTTGYAGKGSLRYAW